MDDGTFKPWNETFKLYFEMKMKFLRLQTLSLTLYQDLKWLLDLLEIMTKSRVDTMMFWEFLGDNKVI